MRPYLLALIPFAVGLGILGWIFMWYSISGGATWAMFPAFGPAFIIPYMVLVNSLKEEEDHAKRRK